MRGAEKKSLNWQLHEWGKIFIVDERQDIQRDLEELRTERQRSRLDMAKAREAGMKSEHWKREKCKE